VSKLVIKSGTKLIGKLGIKSGSKLVKLVVKLDSKWGSLVEANWNQVRHQVRNYIEKQVWWQVSDQVSNQVWKQASSHVLDQVWIPVWDLCNRTIIIQINYSSWYTHKETLR